MYSSTIKNKTIITAGAPIHGSSLQQFLFYFHSGLNIAYNSKLRKLRISTKGLIEVIVMVVIIVLTALRLFDVI
jgi:tryptophan-rich sensory protein